MAFSDVDVGLADVVKTARITNYSNPTAIYVYAAAMLVRNCHLNNRPLKFWILGTSEGVI